MSSNGCTVLVYTAPVRTVATSPFPGIRVLFTLLALAGGVCHSAPSFAQTSDELSEARAAFQRGIELEQAKNWAGAIKQFRQVGQVKMTPQVRYHIALCEENLGKLVAALGGYELALADAESVGDGVSFKQEVEASVNDLRARIPKVVIQRGAGAEAAAIELDGVALGESSVGVEVPLDPGPHALVATAPGHSDYSETLDVAEEETRTVTIDLKPLPAAPPPDPSGGVPDDDGVADEGGKKYGVYPYVLMGVGGAALITSGILFVVRGQDLAELKDKCQKIDDSNYDCRPVDESERQSLQDKDSRVQTLNYVAPIMLGVGVAAAGAGGALFYLDLKNGKKQTGAAKHVRLVGAAPGADVGGFSLVGQF